MVRKKRKEKMQKAKKEKDMNKKDRRNWKMSAVIINPRPLS